MNTATQDASESYPYAELPSWFCLLCPDKIHPEQLEDIFQANEAFEIIIVPVYVKAVHPCHQVPFQFVEQGDLIGEQSIEMVLHMGHNIKFLLVTIPVIGRQLKAVQVFIIHQCKVAIKMLVIGDLNIF